jgi:hypothetical protein
MEMWREENLTPGTNSQLGTARGNGGEYSLRNHHGRGFEEMRNLHPYPMRMQPWEVQHENSSEDLGLAGP